MLVEVDGDRPPDEITAELLQRLKNRLNLADRRLRLVEQEEVPAAAHDVQLRAGDPVRQQPRVGERDHGVVVAGDDQGGRAEPVQPRKAAPAGRRVELERVSERARCVRQPRIGLRGQL